MMGGIFDVNLPVPLASSEAANNNQHTQLQTQHSLTQLLNPQHSTVFDTRHDTYLPLALNESSE